MQLITSKTNPNSIVRAVGKGTVKEVVEFATEEEASAHVEQIDVELKAFEGFRSQSDTHSTHEPAAAVVDSGGIFVENTFREAIVAISTKRLERILSDNKRRG